MEWTSNGPRSNLESGLVPGGRSRVTVMFGIELVVPFLIFAGRRLRLIAFWPLVTFQVLIAITGNYCFLALPGFKWAKEPDRVSHSGSRWR